MPQDSLWAAAARCNGFKLTYELEPDPQLQQDLLLIRPTWAKQPSRSDGGVALVVPAYARWQVPQVISASFGAFLGGTAKSVPTAARASLRSVLTGYEQGQLG